MTLIRVVCSAVCLLACFASARPAAAQVSLDPILESGIERSVSDRPEALTRLKINYDDCLQNDVFSFELKVRNNSDYVLEVWASSSSADCTLNEERQGTAPECWIVYSARPTSVDHVAVVPVRNIAAQSKGPSEVVQATVEACEKGLDNEITLYFMMVSSGELQGTAKTWKTAIDLVGPIPPVDVSVSAGEDRLQVDWDASDSSQDRLGYDIFCVPLTAAAVANAPTRLLQVNTGGSDAGLSSGDTAGTSSDSGSSGTSGAAGSGGSETINNDTDVSGTAAIDPACEGLVSELVAGERPSPSAVRCGSTGRTAPDGIATGLENGVLYAVGVAAVDTLENRGALSNIACGTPEAVEDFFELYRASGGKGGGGFCQLSAGVFHPLSAGAVSALVLSLGLLFARRRKPSP